MQKNSDKNLKITVKYSEDTLNWNIFVDRIISFLVENNLFEEIGDYE